jgi:fumarate reductase subunit C
VSTRVEAHPARPPAGWWRGNLRYVLYIARELSSVVIALWMLAFLVEIARARSGSGYEAFGGPVWIAFGVMCLCFALLHSWTFLGFAGMIMRIPVGQRTVPAGLIRALAYGGFVVVSGAVLTLLIRGGGR